MTSKEEKLAPFKKIISDFEQKMNKIAEFKIYDIKIEIVKKDNKIKIDKKRH